MFLTHGHRAAPSASVWLSDDHTERGEPMFEARRWYEHWGISVPNWRVRADDHIVPMLQFVAFLLEQGSAEAAADAAVFMDRQMGPWVGDFLGKVSVRADTALYRAAAAFAGALLAEIRAELERITGIAEQIPEPPKRPEVQPDEVAFLPGAAPSW
ncbi:molecular chaperone [Jhaorihella thermophila]